MRLAWLVLVAGCGRVAFGDLDPRALTDASDSQPPCTPVGTTRIAI